jgi:hypothetical protein
VKDLDFMTYLSLLSRRKKIGLVSIALLALLLASGALASTLGTLGESSAGILSSSLDDVPSTSTVLSAAAPTFVGNAHAFLSGPILAPPAFGAPPSASASTANAVNNLSAPQARSLPALNFKPEMTASGPSALSAPPLVKCPGQGCASIGGGSGGATTQAHGLDAVDSGSSYGYDVEPSDQGLCANSQYVIEVLNIGEAQVYSESNLQPVANGYATLDGLMGLTKLNWGSGGDISCMWDSANGGHWFFTEFVSTTPEPFSAFTGCFAGVVDTCREGIAVSTTSNPMGSYNVYFYDPNKINHDPGASAGNLLNDFVKIGSTRDAFLMFYDEFILNSSQIPACPAYGCFGFNGAQQLAFSKNALEMGWPAGKVTVAYENMGTAPNLYPIPANGEFQPAPATCDSGPYVGVCWIQVIPAQTPDPTQYDNNNGGTGYMVGSLDFFGAGDDRVAVFDWQGLSDLNSAGCSSCNGITFGGQILKSGVSYLDEGVACLVQYGGYCGLGNQKAGAIPLGDNCFLSDNAIPPDTPFTPTDSHSCPESGIASNGDGATQVSYADGQIWLGVSTVVVQSFSTSTELHIGSTYWDINTGGKSLSVQREGYVSAAREDLEFPAIAASDNGQALMTFTLSGDEGSDGGYYPSSAYIMLTGSSPMIHITALGQAPHDGFTEYQSYPNLLRPRWGDYSWAVFVPGSKGGFVFATNYIEFSNCSDQAFLNSGGTCDGTRDPYANWGSSVSILK